VTKHYWHSYEFRFLRYTAGHYPKTYQRVGKQLEELGIFKDRELDNKEQLKREFFAIIAAMPPHVVPFAPYGNNKKWREIDWYKTYQALFESNFTSCPVGD
tara:strand:- start:99 stop:401 length:303 start_codon:yes stop_codon:yes gene_type:complete